MKTCRNVDVLLSTYNGDNFLHDQIQSLIRQTYKNWRLIVRDDGSSDQTLSIIDYYVRTFPHQIKLISSGPNLGPAASFGVLCSSATSDYIMFCDQDDVWLDWKVERLLEEMGREETRHSRNKPILVFSDLIVTDRDLNVIDNSFWSYSNKLYTNTKLRKLLFENVAPGCSMMFNRALLDVAQPVPDGVVMHDYWFMLVAALFGRISFISDRTVYYRQHGANRLGAKKRLSHSVPARVYGTILAAIKKRRYVYDLEPYIKQAKLLMQIYGAVLDKNILRLLEDFIHLKDYAYLKRKYKMLSCGFLPFDFLRNVDFFIRF